MKQSWRHLIFFLFLLAFFVAAPMLILYTAGFRYHPETNQILKTGILNVTSFPKNATLFVDGEKQDDRTPAVIDNIFAGSHSLRLEKDGYTTWNKNLTVKSRESTFVDDAILFLLEETEFLKERKGFAASASPTESTIAVLKREGSSIEVSLLDKNDETFILRLPERSGATYDVQWSPNGDYVVVSEKRTSSTNLSLVRTSSKDVARLTLATNDSFSWSLADEHTVYVQRTDVLEEHDLKKGTFADVDQLQAVFPSRQGRFQVQNVNERTVVSFVKDDVAKIVTYLPFSTYHIVDARDEFLLLRDTDKDRIVLINTQDAQHPIALNSEAHFWQWNDDGDLLFSDGFAIQTFNPTTHISETVTRLSQEIQQIAWYPLGHVIVYRTDSGVFAVEQDQRGTQNQNNLTEVEVVSFAIDAKGKNLLLFGSDGDTQGLFLRPLQK